MYLSNRIKHNLILGIHTHTHTHTYIYIYIYIYIITNQIDEPDLTYMQRNEQCKRREHKNPYTRIKRKRN